jgi:hypothetical protein
MSIEMTQAELDQKIADAIAAATTDLKGKNTELLGKMKKAQDKVEAEQLAATRATEKATQDALTAEGKHAEVLDRVRKNSETEIDNLRKRAETAEASLITSTKTLRVVMVDNEISKQLVEAGVTDPVLLEAAAAMINPTAEIIDGENDGEQTVQIAGQPVKEFFEGWKEGKGKAFIANGSSGGGSGGESSGGAGDWEAHFKPETANQSKQNELRLSDPEKYNEMRKKYPLQTTTPTSVRGVM